MKTIMSNMGLYTEHYAPFSRLFSTRNLGYGPIYIPQSRVIETVFSLLQEVESLKEEKKNLQQTISEYEVTLDDMGSKIRS